MRYYVDSNAYLRVNLKRKKRVKNGNFFNVVDFAVFFRTIDGILRYGRVR
jgi:hypothetical protein